MREWNPLWADPESAENAEYLASIRRIIVASVNWIEAHPDFKPEWRELNKRSLMRRQGIPDTMPEDEVAIVAAWDDYYKPQNSHTRQWFRAMVEACRAGDPRNEPSAHMLGKGIACGALLMRAGWDEFDRFMLEHSGDSGGH